MQNQQQPGETQHQPQLTSNASLSSLSLSKSLTFPREFRLPIGPLPPLRSPKKGILDRQLPNEPLPLLARAFPLRLDVERVRRTKTVLLVQARARVRGFDKGLET